MNMHTSFTVPSAPVSKRFNISARPDPIFAKIDTHRAAKKAYADICDYDDHFPREVTRSPRVAHGTYNDLRGNITPHYLLSEKEIRETIKQQRAICGDTKYMRNVRKALKERLLAGFRADAIALKKAQDKAGYTAAAAAYRVADEAEDKAYDALLRTTPTTTAGMAALADYIVETERMYLEDERESACFRALKMLAKCTLRLKGDKSN